MSIIDKYSELREHGGKILALVGVATEYCVRAALIGEKDRNGRRIPNLLGCCGDPIVVEDLICVANLNSGDREKAKDEMRERGVVFVFEEKDEMREQGGRL